jgi:hypothetical protein
MPSLIEVRRPRLTDEVDPVFDLDGGEVLERSWSVLKLGGVLVSVVQGPAESALARRADARSIFFVVEAERGELVELARRINAGQLRPIVADVLPLARPRSSASTVAASLARRSSRWTKRESSRDEARAGDGGRAALGTAPAATLTPSSLSAAALLFALEVLPLKRKAGWFRPGPCARRPGQPDMSWRAALSQATGTRCGGPRSPGHAQATGATYAQGTRAGA